MADTAALERWIVHVFDHPVGEPHWYWCEDARKWPEDCLRVPEFIAETFERASELLAQFPDDRLDQGFWYLIGASDSYFPGKLLDERTPAATRHRAVRSCLPLFEQVMAPRCTATLSHLSEQPENPLNSSCYMWWDLLRFEIWHSYPVQRDPNDPRYESFHAEILATMKEILAIPHDACRESALHGLGHLSRDYPQHREQFATVIDEFLARNSTLRPELIAYAKRAQIGAVK